ncbi:MAG TPA: DNA-binding domain-containing protein [Myxococcota bacterium]|nr:DNA-binding domain-containing protein [Myxococcota bacterium]
MLAELQREFARELFGGGERLAIHRRNVAAAHADALAAIHPACLSLVGEEFFAHCARRFAREVPSRSPDLNDYGAELGGFLARFEPARALPYLADVARLEWLLHRARHSLVSEAIDAARLAALEPERRAELRFPLAPGTGLLASPYPVDRIHAASQPGAGDARVDLDDGAACLVVAREPGGAAFARVAPAEFGVLAGLARGEPLAHAAAEFPDSADALAQLLARASARRWLAGFA